MSERNPLRSGPQVGDFVASREVPETEGGAGSLPQQEAFFRPPVRFGSVPVEAMPLGYDAKRGYQKAFPPVSLPTQVVERVSFGHPELEPNRLFWGDNLHVMRSLPSESIDLIYIDPPFFSGRNYNMIFGDRNELRSFSDIWEGGMPGYLIWLNARLVEMKRLLKPTGSIFIHLDWRAIHYVKVEMDKIFGAGTSHEGSSLPGFRNEIIWFHNVLGTGSKTFPKTHETILWYTKSTSWTHNSNALEIRIPYSTRISKTLKQDEEGRWYYVRGNRESSGTLSGKYFRTYVDPEEIAKGKFSADVWEDPKSYRAQGPEVVGYKTQKPERLLERIIAFASNPGETVADFFAGGGTTANVAQRLQRRWITCDQSRVAVAITADRLTKTAEQPTLSVVAPKVPGGGGVSMFRVSPTIRPPSATTTSARSSRRSPAIRPSRLTLSRRYPTSPSSTGACTSATG